MPPTKLLIDPDEKLKSDWAKNKLPEFRVTASVNVTVPVITVWFVGLVTEFNVIEGIGVVILNARAKVLETRFPLPA